MDRKDAASIITSNVRIKAPLEYSGMADAFRKSSGIMQGYRPHFGEDSLICFSIFYFVRIDLYQSDGGQGESYWRVEKQLNADLPMVVEDFFICTQEIFILCCFIISWHDYFEIFYVSIF